MNDDQQHPEDGSDPRVSEIYRSLAVESPPEHIDRAVLRNARSELQARNGRSYGRTMSWLRPLAWAATVGLCLAIVLDVSEVPQPELDVPESTIFADDAAERTADETAQPLKSETLDRARKAAPNTAALPADTDLRQQHEAIEKSGWEESAREESTQDMQAIDSRSQTIPAERSRHAAEFGSLQVQGSTDAAPFEDTTMLREDKRRLTSDIAASPAGADLRDPREVILESAPEALAAYPQSSAAPMQQAAEPVAELENFQTQGTTDAITVDDVPIPSEIVNQALERAGHNEKTAIHRAIPTERSTDDTGPATDRACDSDQTENASSWLDCILDLEKTGQTEAAEDERKKLAETFPDFEQR